MITALVAEALEAAGLLVRRCDVSPVLGTTGFRYHFERIKRYFSAIRALGQQNSPTILYVSMQGGAGLFYDLILVTAARLKKTRCVIHHHSFAYLSKPNMLVRAIVAIAGPDQLHIALCEKMMRCLRERYGAKLVCRTISNLAFVTPPVIGPDVPRGDADCVIGYLANISFEKGIDRYLDLVCELRKLSLNVHAKIAGPFSDPKVRAYVEERITKIGGIEYLGPIYGDAKTQFFQSIDLFVFPTRYINEAQPLVIYEAQTVGVPVAATDRGCLGDMVTAWDILLDACADDMTPAITRISKWATDSSALQSVKKSAKAGIAALTGKGARDLQRFLEIFETSASMHQPSSTVVQSNGR